MMERRTLARLVVALSLLSTRGALVLSGDLSRVVQEEHACLENGYPSAKTLTVSLLEMTWAANARGEGSPSERFVITTSLARTATGHRRLLIMLQDHDPDRVSYALRFLAAAPDTNEIGTVLSCADQHLGNDRVVRGALMCLSGILCTEFAPPRDASREAHAMAIQTARHWLAEHETHFKGKSYGDIAAARVDVALKAFRRNRTGQAKELLSCAFLEFLQTTDSQLAASHIIRWIASVDIDAKETDLLVGFIAGLRLYVGPLNLPDEASPMECRKAQFSIATWWDRNRDKQPVYWMLGKLAERGYATNRPEQVEQLADALVLALRSEHAADRYAAARILATVLPDGDGLPLNDDGVVAPLFEARTPRMKFPRDYINGIVAERALRWAIWDCYGYRWNSARGAYERGVRAVEGRRVNGGAWR